MFGYTELQPAAVPVQAPAVVYVPHLHAHGSDTFEYSATDCPGNHFRTSSPTSVAIHIRPVNDPPLPRDLSYDTAVDLPTQITLSAFDPVTNLATNPT